MAASIKTVGVIGASGNLGPSIVHALVSHGYEVTAITRETSKATFPDPIHVVRTDYLSSSLPGVFKGLDAIVVTVGAEAFGEQRKYIDAAVEAGVKRFFPCEFGSDTAEPEVIKLVPALGAKTQIIEYLKSKESATFSWTSIVTGAFFDWGLKAGFLGFDIKNQSARIWDKGETTFSATNLSTVGETVAKVLSADSFQPTANQLVHVQSYTTTQNQILAGFEKLSGAKWKVEDVDGESTRKDALAKFHAGDYSTIIVLLQAATLGRRPVNYGDFSHKIWNDKLSLPKEDFEADLKAVLEGKRPEL